MDQKTLMGAIRDLREHMGLSQDAFAKTVFKKTLPTQQRYETVRPPKSDHLTTLVHVARQNHREDLAEIFKIAAIESIPLPIRELILEPAKPRSLRAIHPKR